MSCIVNVVGNVGAAPESFQTKNETLGASFSLAVKDFADGVETTSWHRVTAFGKKAETILKYLNKGDKISVTGKGVAKGYMNKESKLISYIQISLLDFEFVNSAKKVENLTQEGHEVKPTSAIENNMPVAEVISPDSSDQVEPPAEFNEMTTQDFSHEV